MTSIAIKKEPTDDDMDEIEADQATIDAAMAGALAPPPPVRPKALRTKTTIGPSPTPTTRITIDNEKTVRRVTLTPLAGRQSPTVAATLPHESGVFSLNDYDEPSQAELAASRASGEASLARESSGSVAAFTDFIVARTTAGGSLIQSRTTGGIEGTGAGYTNLYVKTMMQAPPHRSMPASNSDFAALRLDAIPLEREHFEELCSTPGAGQPPCCAGAGCKALLICNAQGAPINNTPWVAMYFSSERARIDGPDREAFRREWAQRMCVLCEMFVALRVFINSSVTNSAVNVTANVKAAIRWFVLCNIDGEFCQKSTFGPDPCCTNGFVGNCVMPAINGWRLRPAASTSARIRFVGPYPPYPPSVDGMKDGARGFV